jgi:hypothetical protein
MRHVFPALAVATMLGACSVGVDERSSLGGHVPGTRLSTDQQAETAAYRGSAGGTVTAESRYGTATVSGPTRIGPKGRPEVRLPGGTWIECVRSCSETLRRESIDFWQSRGGRNDPVDGPAYFSRWW